MQENVQDPQGRNLDGKAHQSSVDPSIGAHQGTPLRNTGVNEEIMQAFRSQVMKNLKILDFSIADLGLENNRAMSSEF